MSASLVKLALMANKCTQKELAKKIKVSETQISKWKKGETISPAMEEKLKELAAVGNRNPDIVLWTGGITQADQWNSLIQHLAQSALEESESGYDTNVLEEDLEALLLNTLSSLREIGFMIPQEFPNEIASFLFENQRSEKEAEDEYEQRREEFLETPLVKLIHQAFLEVNGIEGFYQAYIFPLISENEDLELEFLEEVLNIKDYLIPLAFAKSSEQSDELPNFHSWRYNVQSKLRTKLTSIKRLAIKQNVPLEAELTDLLSLDGESLSLESEAKAFHFNESNMHPDIYMNEILTSLRLIKKVLPVIVKKLGVTPKEFEALGIDPDWL